MAEKIIIGSKVQEVDELGRWEAAKVIGREADNFLVSFAGWDKEWVRLVDINKIKNPVPPKEEQKRRKYYSVNCVYSCLKKPLNIDMYIVLS